MNLKTEVLIIGGGATGVGIARDLSLRGIPSLLIEKGDFLSGASGRNHGLFHSGARYVVSDPEAARECITENRILRKIVPHCIEETDGLFVSLPEDDLDFRDRFIQACQEITIPAHLLSRDETLSLEPELHPDLLSSVKVPDGAIDPFELVLGNAKDAEDHGAKFLLHTEITSLLLEGNRIKSVLAKDLVGGDEYSIETSYLINATGAWADHFLKRIGLRIGVALSKGSMLITNQRFTQRVINRCRPPSDGDIIVPNHTVSILGTTSVRSEEVEQFEITPEEITLLIKETSRMIPAIEGCRFIRAYAGIRPLFQSGEKGDDRAISRGFALIDHGKRDGIKNLITITGGKLVTYRLMAEKTSDLLCQKMGVDVSCTTHIKPLPGAEKSSGLKNRLAAIGQEETLCDCELVQKAEVEAVLKEGKLKNLQDILHRTRLAKGTCQGAFCVYRLLGVLHDLGMVKVDSNKVLKGFLEERWKGIRPVLWGSALKEEELIEGIYKGIFNL
ncbi:MAG: anaerobic glycerol-3-phosphate dehydrogenase subunit A [Deltaproteobacteria bacterium]|nr:anaerobic glycerol-3-phosphate dehydrogenase subunit A [Deltaproteobacteria bacterium]MBM4325150.1 anaerobic glycerol-3-phosphate dehydrogenase subunit A [Deltaproteobacteria bacterium]